MIISKAAVSVDMNIYVATVVGTGPPTQLFARAADFSDVTTDCAVTKFYETFFCSVFGIY